jgi:hypothetical protein
VAKGFNARARRLPLHAGRAGLIQLIQTRRVFFVLSWQLQTHQVQFGRLRAILAVCS